MAKRGAAKAVALPRRKANANAYEQLPENPTATDLKNAEVNVSLAELEDRVADVRDSWETDSLFEDAFEELTADSKVTIGGELVHVFLLWSTRSSRVESHLGRPS